MPRNRTYPAPWPQRNDVPQVYGPIDDQDSGGRPKLPIPRTYVNTMVDQVDRFPGNANDSQILRDRRPAYHVEYLSSGRDSGLVNWTAAGPVRRELHTHQATLRLMQGNTMTRNLDPTPTGYGSQLQGHGMHSTPPSSFGTPGRYQATTQMRRPRSNRLQPGQYNGQSYSETTRLQQAGY